MFPFVFRIRVEIFGQLFARYLHQRKTEQSSLTRALEYTVFLFCKTNLAPPTLDVQRSTPNLKIVMEGDTLSLKCAATGKPEPVISWYRTVETDSPEQTKEGRKRSVIYGMKDETKSY